MKLIHSLNTPNHFNKPAYNNYYSGYSNNYQPNNQKCRKSFRDTNPRNRLSYELEKLKITEDDIRFRNDMKNNMLRPLISPDYQDCLNNPDVSDDVCTMREFWKCFEKECTPLGGGTIQEEKRKERDGCRQREVIDRSLLVSELCRPKNPSCDPSLIEVRPRDVVPLPPIYGEWKPIPPEEAPECYECEDETDTDNRQLEQAILDAKFDENCSGSIITGSIQITGPASEGTAGIIDSGEWAGELGYAGRGETDVDTAKADCKQSCKFSRTPGANVFAIVNGYIVGHNAVDYFYEVLSFTETATRDYVTATIVTSVQIYIITNRVGKFDRTIEGMSRFYYTYSVDAILTNNYYFFRGRLGIPIKKFPKGSCLNWFGVSKYCYDGTSRHRGSGPKGGPPPEKPKPRKPKERLPECMESCTCEQVEQLLKKYLPKVEGRVQLSTCQGEHSFTWEGEGLHGINSGLIQLASMLGYLSRDICPEIKGTFQVPKCSDRGFHEVSYDGKGMQGIEKQLQALAEINKRAYIDSCENQLDIKIEIERLPQRIQIQLSDDFALIISKLNQILSKIGKDDNLFSRILEIITFIATLLGLINDIRSLFERQKDYTPDLELIKELLQEIKRLLNVNVQGSIDAIKCDGTISSNSWSGEGLEGLNQAITALGINTAILHSDICELIGRKQDEIQQPLLQGSIDAIKCDGTIIGSSWSGKGFDGLNQAITAIGNNLAILHADLCELLKGEKETFEIIDKYKCGDEEVEIKEVITDTTIRRELLFLYERLKRIETLICELECNAVPVFPGDSIEEREIPAQAVITFVETRYYPFLKGSKWHINIPYPKDNLITDKNCWQKFNNLTITKGNVYGRLIWRSPNDTINRFWTAIYGDDEERVRDFLTRIAEYSKLKVQGIRISKGANPRVRPKDVTIKAVKVAILERSENGMQVTKCCRAPKK